MMESTTRLTDPLTMLPAEYWGQEGSVYGALADDMSADGLVIFSVRDMPIGSKLNIRIFYANEYELDDIKAVSHIVRKDVHIAEDWKGQKYTLKFTQMYEEDLGKLTNLLRSDLRSGKMSVMGGIALENHILERTKSSPPFVNLELPEKSADQCKFYKNAKCLKTRAFCDLCQNEDETDLVQGRGTKSRSSSPFTSILSKLADNFRSAFQSH